MLSGSSKAKQQVGGKVQTQTQTLGRCSSPMYTWIFLKSQWKETWFLYLISY